MLKLNRKIKSIAIICLLFQNIYALQFGNGNDESTTDFVNVAEDVKDFCIDLFTTYIIKNDDSLWGTGLYVNRDFKNNDCPTNIFEKVDDNVAYFNGFILIKNDGSAYEIYQNDLGTVKENLNFKFKKESGPFYIMNDNTLWVEGEDEYGAFGTGKDKVYFNRPVKVRNNVLDVNYARFFTLIITDKNELMISGNHYLPYPYEKCNKFIKIADNVRYTINNFYITEDDELYVFGWAGSAVTGLGDLGDKWKILPTKVMDNVESVACNQQATLILMKDGTLYGCGGDSPNYCGELGFGDYQTVYTPKYIMKDVKKIGLGNNYSIVLKNDGSMWMCGANNQWESGL